MPPSTTVRLRTDQGCLGGPVQRFSTSVDLRRPDRIEGQMPLWHRTFHLPNDGLRVTILHLTGPLTVEIWRSLLAADWYILLGECMSPKGTPSGYGAYVGTSDALRAQTQRVGVSLRSWTTGLGRLVPDTIVLIRRSSTPITGDTRLLVEAAMARYISGAGYSILNWRTAAPTPARRATRQQRLWAVHASDELARLVLAPLLSTHPPAARGGSIREQLIRLVLAQDPLRGMDVDDVLEAATLSGLIIAGRTPRQRTRRDVTTRELSDGRPRLHRIWIQGRTVVYPASLSVRQARQTYSNAHATAA